MATVNNSWSPPRYSERPKKKKNEVILNPCSCCTYMSEPSQKVGKDSYKFSLLSSKCLNLTSQATYLWDPQWLKGRKCDINKPHELYFSLS